MEIGTVQQVDIDQEMQVAYLDYAMSVIVSRALPDVRDGLKPVHRRILYAMHDMGLHPHSPYRKSARIVGEVLGKYHPHGDAAVYESMVRMAQDFSMRYTLVDGQGNFGSIDGDSAAAMRYTEARLEALAEEMLSDIQKQTVDFGPNFDGSLQEPLVLPAAFPNLIVNGSAGIAVGMATNIPPHNLGEVCDAITYLIDHYNRVEEISVDELMQFIKGPDFPTGGIVYTANGNSNNGDDVEDYLVNAYATGRGRITVQAKAHIEEMSRNRNRIVVTELPYQVNKSRLIERIAELVRDGKLEGITDLRDESDRQGMRMVIELTRNVDPRQLLSRLYRLTPMRSTFSIMMLALVDGEPRTLSLRRLLHHFVEHRREIVTRRSEYDLARARERAHILEGLLVALSNLDEVIQIIRRSRTAETAHANLCKRFKLTDIQAQAILDMPLRRLAALERQKIEQEYQEKLKLIAYLEDLLTHPAKILAVIKEELTDLKKKYGDARRTQIMRGASAEVIPTGIVPDEMGIVIVERSGRIRREPENRRNTFAIGQGGQVPEHVVLANARDTLVCLSQEGRALPLPAHHVPYTESPEVKTLGDLTSLKKSTELAYVLTLPSLDSDDAPDEGYLVTLTAAGKIKRSNLADVRRALARGDTLLMNVDEGDRLFWAVITPGGRELILVTSQGKAIRFGEEEVRPTGLGAGGVLAMKIDPDDRLVGAGLVSDARLLTVSENGYGKVSVLTEYPAQKRYGTGIVAARLSPRTGLLATAAVVDSDARIILHTTKGSARRYKATDFPIMGRSSLGRPAEGISSSDPIVGAVFLVGAPDDHPEVAGGKPSPTSPPAAPPRSHRAGTHRKAPTAKPSEAKKRGTGRSPEQRGSTAKKQMKRKLESEAVPRAETGRPRQAELELTIEPPRMKTTPTRRPPVTQRPPADEEIDLPVKSRTARRGTAKTVAPAATPGRTAPRADRPKADEELDIPVKHRPVRKGRAGPRQGPAGADDELDLPLTKRRAAPRRRQHPTAEDELDLPPAARKPSGKPRHRTDTTKPK